MTFANQSSSDDIWENLKQRLQSAQAALAQATDREPANPEEVLQERARQLAETSRTAPELEEGVDVVLFDLAGEQYAIEDLYIREVLILKELTPIPGTPPFVLGITNIRGEILSVVDIRPFLDLPPLESTENKKLIIVDWQMMEIALAVDGISGVQKICPPNREAYLATLEGKEEAFLKMVTEDRVSILDIEKLLTHPKMIINQDEDGE